MNSADTNSGGWEKSHMRQFIGNRMITAIPTVWESMIAKVKINSTIGNQSTDIYTSEDFLYIPCINELSGDNYAIYSDEGGHIEWFVSDVMRAKFKGIIVPEDASYYTGSSEPSLLTSNDVKIGDVWYKSPSYIYVSQDYLDKYNISADISANIGGGWVLAGRWWTRSPNINNTAWWNVGAAGGLNSNINYVYPLCLCFSI